MPLPFYRERHFYLCISCPCHRHRWMAYCRLNLHHRWTSHYCSDHRHHCMSHYHFDLRQLLTDLRLLLDRLRSAFRLTLLDFPNGTGTSVPNAGIFDTFSSFSAKGVRHLRFQGMQKGSGTSISKVCFLAYFRQICPDGVRHYCKMGVCTIHSKWCLTPLPDQLP